METLGDLCTLGKQEFLVLVNTGYKTESCFTMPATTVQMYEYEQKQIGEI